jgi:2-polyprenyl-3-methyl-5-hydroxy-6-metoxy-1,4-benzoquinol methylase
MDAFYAAAYPELYRKHWWWRAREEILLREIGRMLHSTTDAEILDVGCGAGLFFDALTRFGRVTGVESDATALERSGKWRSQIHIGDLTSITGRYNLILLLDVLEHLHDPEIVLRQAAGRLAPGGHILVTVPAFNWLWTTHDDLNHHVRRYSAAAIRETIRKAGLAAVDASYMFQSLIVPKIMMRIGEAVASSAPQVPTVPWPAVNRALTAWYRLEYGFMGWLPFGASVIAVAAQPPGPSR